MKNEEELLRLVKSYIIDIWELRKSKLYGSGTGPLQYRSRPGRDTTYQGKGRFGKLGGEKSHWTKSEISYTSCST